MEAKEESAKGQSWLPRPIPTLPKKSVILETQPLQPGWVHLAWGVRCPDLRAPGIIKHPKSPLL